MMAFSEDVCGGDGGVLRILMVSDFFHPNIGGVESHIYHLAQNLMKMGHRVVILTHAYQKDIGGGGIDGNTEQKQQQQQEEEDAIYLGIEYLTNGLKVYYEPRRPVYQSATLPTVFGGFSRLREVVVAERIDLIHAHQAFSAMANEAVIHGRTMNIPTVFTDHSLFGFADASSILMNKALKFSLADVQRVICVSHTSRENTVLRACIPPSRVYVVPNAVDTSMFFPACFQLQSQVDEARETIVIMSRLVYRKGIDLLISILPLLSKKYPSFKFLIGGDGPKHSELVEAVKIAGLGDRVRLAGAIPHEKVREFLIQGSIFLNCSLTEAFCVALVEAAAAGLLVVSTAVGGVPEVLPDNIMVLADASPSGLIKAVEQAIERLPVGMKPVEINQLALRQHQAVTEMYSWSAVAKRTEIVYRDALECNSTIIDRMKRYYLCGKWFGKLCCLLATMDWMYLKCLEWWQPAAGIPPAKDFPFPYQ